MEKTEKRLLILGSIGLDTVETPNGISESQMGGSASYASIAASYFCKPSIIGIVGQDFTHCHIFKKRNIDLSGLETKKGKTFFWHGRYRESFKERDTIATDFNVFEDFHPVLQKQHSKIETILLANIHPALQLEVLRQIESPKFIIADSMDLWIETAREDLEVLTKNLDLLIINDEEAQQWSDKTDLRIAAKSLLEKGPKFVIIKLGPNGAMLFSQDEFVKIDTYFVDKLIDPTGAGDTFAGAVAGYLVSLQIFDFKTTITAMKFGSIIASFCVEGFGLEMIQNLEKQDILSRINRLQNS